MTDTCKLLVTVFFTIQQLIPSKHFAVAETRMEFEMQVEELQCEMIFQRNLDDCLKLSLFYQIKPPEQLLKQLLVTLFLEHHCRQYVSSLQCTHELISRCSTRETIHTIQSYLGQPWALTANYLCNINQENSEMKKFTEAYIKFGNISDMFSNFSAQKPADDKLNSQKLADIVKQTYSLTKKDYPSAEEDSSTSMRTTVTLASSIHHDVINLESQTKQNELKYVSTKQLNALKAQPAATWRASVDRRANTVELETNRPRQSPSSRPDDRSIVPPSVIRTMLQDLNIKQHVTTNGELQHQQ